MATNDTSKPLGPVWAIAVGVILMLLGLAFLAFIIISIHNGEIWRFSRNHSGLVSRAKSPGQFWLSAFFSSVMGLFMVFFAGKLLKEGFKKLFK